MEEQSVTIPISRYEELLCTECRTSTLIKLLSKEKTLSVGTIFRILGCDIIAEKIEKGWMTWKMKWF